MCDEHVDHWHTEERKSRTWKKCSECRGLIAPGDRYVRLVSINDGTAETFNIHVPCNEIADEVADDYGDDGCRMMMPASALHELSNADSGREPAVLRSRLRWMRVNSRGRYALALSVAWGAQS